jgi:hypothetical protein
MMLTFFAVNFVGFPNSHSFSPGDILAQSPVYRKAVIIDSAWGNMSEFVGLGLI